MRPPSMHRVIRPFIPAACLLGSFSHGEEPVAPVPAETEEVLEEITVTASKLDETIFETNSSVGKVGAERIEGSQIRGMNDAYRFLGNVSAPQFVDGGFVIRGINSESPDAENISGNQTPLSSIFVDGVALTQQGARRGPTGMWDVASLEVMRGPQSTLQGRNSLAGSVNIRTKDPSAFLEGALRSTVGELDNEEWAGMFNVPLTPELALRFTAEHAEIDSFVRYPNLKSYARYDDFKTSDYSQLRAKALYQPQGLPLKSLFTYTFSESSPALSDVYGPNARQPGAPPIDDYFDYVWQSGSPAQQIRDTRNHTAAWENTYELAGGLELTALSTFTRTELHVGQIDGRNGSGNNRNDTESDYTQEVRLNWDEDWGKAVLGVYGARSEGESARENNPGNKIEKRRVNAAIFGEADYRLTPRFHLIAGGRIDHDDFEFQSNIAGSGRGASESDNTELLPKIGARHHFSDTHTLGFTIQKGYQSGGAGIDLDGVPFTFDPSTTWHYELAWRKSFLDGKLIAAANAFYTDWKDQQVVLRTIDGTTFNSSERVINAAESSLFGGEIEITWNATEELTFFSSVGLLSTRYDDFTYQIDPAIAAFLGIPDTLDYAGYEFPEAPSFNFSIGFEYRMKNGLFFNADAAYASSYYSPVLFAPTGAGFGGISAQVPQDDVIKVDPSFNVNIALGYERENWKVTLFVKNLLNEHQVIGEVPEAVSTGSSVSYRGDYLATVGPPRFIGAAFEVRF